jgi:hypothetical protein
MMRLILHVNRKRIEYIMTNDRELGEELDAHRAMLAEDYRRQGRRQRCCLLGRQRRPDADASALDPRRSRLGDAVKRRDRTVDFIAPAGGDT